MHGSMTLRVAAWLLLPVCVWLLCHAVLVRPARRQLAQAQQALLVAEREELSAQMGLEREDRQRTWMQREIKDLLATSERMRVAERTAQAALDAAEAAHHRPSWIYPGQSARVSRTPGGGAASPKAPR